MIRPKMPPEAHVNILHTHGLTQLQPCTKTVTEKTTDTTVVSSSFAVWKTVNTNEVRVLTLALGNRIVTQQTGRCDQIRYQWWQTHLFAQGSRPLKYWTCWFNFWSTFEQCQCFYLWKELRVSVFGCHRKKNTSHHFWWRSYTWCSIQRKITRVQADRQ